MLKLVSQYSTLGKDCHSLLMSKTISYLLRVTTAAGQKRAPVHGHGGRQLPLQHFGVLTTDLSKQIAQDLHIWSQCLRAAMPTCTHPSRSIMTSLHILRCTDSRIPNPEDPARSWHSAGADRQHVPQASICLHGPFSHRIQLWVSATKAPHTGHPVPVPSQDTCRHSCSRSRLTYNTTGKLRNP